MFCTAKRLEKGKKKVRSWRARLELLESRMAPAIISVTTTADELNPEDGQVSLREAINQAGAGDTIVLPAGTYAITRSNPGGVSEDANASGDFDLHQSVTIQGAGAASTIIQGEQGDGSTDRVFDVHGAITVQFTGLTIRDGNVNGDGGGIRAATGGIVKLTNSIVENNRARGAGGGIFVGSTQGESGGSTGSLILETSTVRDNQAVQSEGAVGAGIASFGSNVSITGSTISGNTADGRGGGIYMSQATASNTLTITNSTISGNHGSMGGGIDIGWSGNNAFLANVTITGNDAGQVGGIFALDATCHLTNTIVAKNTNTEDALLDDLDGQFISNGNNLIGIGGFTDLTDGVNGDKVGSVETPLDPLLGPLQDNGGPTFTHALLPGSPAINAGATEVTAVDQRDVPRDSQPDIGAFEYVPPTGGTGSIAGMVFLDYNANAGPDAPAEPPLGGMTVYLDTNNNGVLDPGETTATTGPDGHYQFTGLAAGTYTVRQDYHPSHGMMPTGPEGAAHTVVLPADAGMTGINFGDVFVSEVTPIMKPYQDIFPQTPDAPTAFVQGLYHSVLGRDAEPAGLTFWVQQVQGGGSRAAVVAGFWTAPEHRQLQVQEYYRTLLHRDAEPGGLAFHTQEFVTGGCSEADVVLGILTSPEYRQLYASDAAFVEALYSDVLSRASDAGGKDFWMQALKVESPRAVAALFINSDESFLRSIDGNYALFLHRAPETAVDPETGMTGRDFWLNQLRAGRKPVAAVVGVPPALQGGPQSLGAVGEQFLSLPEYYSGATASVTP
jgi:hypothetical protein